MYAQFAGYTYYLNFVFLLGRFLAYKNFTENLKFSAFGLSLLPVG